MAAKAGGTGSTTRSADVFIGSVAGYGSGSIGFSTGSTDGSTNGRAGETGIGPPGTARAYGLTSGLTGSVTGTSS